MANPYFNAFTQTRAVHKDRDRHDGRRWTLRPPPVGNEFFVPRLNMMFFMAYVAIPFRFKAID